MKTCAACHEDLPKDSYSKKQWKLDEYQRRCKVCTANNREVQPLSSKLKQDNNDQNIMEITKALNSMYSDAEISEEELFKQPPPAEDCPICFLQMPSFNGKHTSYKYMSCCGKMLCSGCSYAPVYDNQGNIVAKKKCPFCRTPWPNSDEDMEGRYKKRVEADDPIAIFNHGCDYENGAYGRPQDYAKALELFQRAGELGYAAAYCKIGHAYQFGEGVDKNDKKALYFYELAAIRGEVYARHNLGLNEARTGNMDRAVKHYTIAIRSGGHAPSLEAIKKSYSKGSATKDDYTKALRAYQEYLGEIKSPQRDEADAFSEELYRYY